jgi:hypothetical protein
MPDTSELMLRLEKIKRIDMRVAVDVAGIANMQVRDVNGNLLPLVWTRQSVNNEYENANCISPRITSLQKEARTRNYWPVRGLDRRPNLQKAA